MPQIVVIGAGVFGAWAAWHLRAAGAQVTMVEAYSPGHSRSSSGDESRITRCGYGTDEVYSRFAHRSLRSWRELSSSIGDDQPPLLHRCGVLWLARGDDPYTAATCRTLEHGGYPVQPLDPAALRHRYPHLNPEGISTALLEPEGGVLMARRAVAALAARLMKDQVEIIRGRVDGVYDVPGPLRTVRLSGGGELRADVFVFACGAWLPKVFPALLRDRIRPTRQVVMYFGTPAADERFGPAHTPAWVDFEAGIYGVPDLEGRGMKVGIDKHGPPFDPDVDDRTLDARSLALARAWLSHRFPDMAEAPLAESRVCQYENTPTGDFLIDRHPSHENVWIVGGGSGHGFKHGPAVGEYVARLIAGDGEVEPRFGLAAKAVESARAVY
jgi:glycine/D-amino acid oxidase-like deaminating enzyme